MRVSFLSTFLVCAGALAAHDGTIKRKAAADIKPPEGLVLAADPGPPPREGLEIKETKDRFAHWEKRFDALKAEYPRLAGDDLKKRRLTRELFRNFSVEAMDCYRWFSDRPVMNPDAVDGYFTFERGREGSEMGLGMENNYPTIHDTDRQRDVYGSVIRVPRTSSAEDLNVFSGKLDEEKRANLFPKRNVTIETYRTERGDVVAKFHEKSDKREVKIYCVGYYAGSVETVIARQYEQGVLDRWAKTQAIAGGGRRLLTERVFPALRYLTHGNNDERSKAEEYLKALLGSSEGLTVFRALHDYAKFGVDGQNPAPLGTFEKEALADILERFSPDWEDFGGLAYRELVNAPWVVARAKLLNDIAVQMRKDRKELEKLLENPRRAITDEIDISKYHERMLKAAGFELVEFKLTEPIAKVKKDGIEMTIRLENDSIEVVKDAITRPFMEVDVSNAFGKRLQNGKVVVDPHLKRLQLSRFPDGKAIFKTRVTMALRTALREGAALTATVDDWDYYRDLKDFLGEHFPSSWIDIHLKVPTKKHGKHELLEGEASVIGERSKR